eukprot:6184445-Pleurochrysis_carterae.AAC.6
MARNEIHAFAQAPPYAVMLFDEPSPEPSKGLHSRLAAAGQEHAVRFALQLSCYSRRAFACGSACSHHGENRRLDRRVQRLFSHSHIRTSEQSPSNRGRTRSEALALGLGGHALS